MACLAWLIPLLAYTALNSLGQHLYRTFLRSGDANVTDVFSYEWVFSTLTESQVPCQLSVAAAWVSLALSGRWRSEPSWIDRTGRVLGVYFLASIPPLVLIPYLL